MVCCFKLPPSKGILVGFSEFEVVFFEFEVGFFEFVRGFSELDSAIFEFGRGFFEFGRDFFAAHLKKTAVAIGKSDGNGGK